MLTTAGNLTVYTTQGGEFRVVDATSGKILYSVNLRHGGQGRADHLHAQRQAVHRAGAGRHCRASAATRLWNTEFGSIVVGFTR